MSGDPTETNPDLYRFVFENERVRVLEHTLRHRFATTAYGVERDLRAVQELLGHSKPETTARYVAVPEGALRTAVAGVTVSKL